MADSKVDPRLDPRIDPARTAIIYIDLQNDIIRSTANPFYSSIAEQVKQRKVVENAVSIRDAAHAAGAPVFYVTVVRRHDYEDVVNQLTELVAAGKAPPPKEQVSLIEGTKGAALVEELRPARDDYVIVKKRRNAFYGTELDFHLRCRGITTLVIGGVATDLGVENTVRDAWDRDYNVVVVEDLCVAAPPEAHSYAIKSVFPRMARIMSTSEIVTSLRAA